VADDLLESERKRASRAGLLLGGITFVLGALICLAYLLIKKPWKPPSERDRPPAAPGPAFPHED